LGSDLIVLGIKKVTCQAIADIRIIIQAFNEANSRCVSNFISFLVSEGIVEIIDIAGSVSTSNLGG